MKENPLGKTVAYPERYDPGLLVPLARADNRLKLGIEPGKVPFEGADIWNAYELSWLDARGLQQKQHHSDGADQAQAQEHQPLKARDPVPRLPIDSDSRRNQDNAQRDYRTEWENGVEDDSAFHPATGLRLR